MEFPKVGERCAFATCQQLDFLPFKCSGCQQVFCLEHRNFDNHACSSPTRDVQLLICPLCNQPVPGKPEEDPNIRLDQHILQGCKPAASKKSSFHKCTARNCNTKILVPIICPKCKQEFCVKHRMEVDHACQGTKTGTLRFQPPSTNLNETKTRPQSTINPPKSSAPQTRPASVHASSMNRTPPTSRQAAGTPSTMEQEDEMLARAIQLSMEQQLEERRLEQERRRREQAGQPRQPQQPPPPPAGQLVEMCIIM